MDSKYCLVAISTPHLEQSQIENTQMKNASRDSYLHQLAGQWLEIQNRFPMLHGICIPSLCTEPEVQLLIEKCKYMISYMIPKNPQLCAVFWRHVWPFWANGMICETAQ